MTGREISGGGKVGQETEQNGRRSEGADHKVGLGGSMFKYFGKTVRRGSTRNGETQKKLKIMERHTVGLES